MAALENTVYTALRPVQILTKVFGFCTNKRSVDHFENLISHSENCLIILSGRRREPAQRTWCYTCRADFIVKSVPNLLQPGSVEI